MKDDDLYLIDDSIKQFEILENENINEHLKEYPKLISVLDNTIFKYSCLSYHLIKYQKTLPVNINHLQFFVTSVANNAIVLKKLFLSGWHLQSQSIMRVQFEQINIALSIICDNDFFKKYHKLQQIKKEKVPFSPKQKETKNIIRKLLIKRKGKEFYNAIESLMDFLYKELSRSIHGNFLHIAMLSYSVDFKKDILTPGIGGNMKSIPRTVYTLQEMNNYSQIMFTFLRILVKESKEINFEGTDLNLNFMEKTLILKNGTLNQHKITIHHK
ncbi:hypothetical protein DIS18_00830 [Algibacter marinivivus]|uniref:Uncharacterized protein n=1 Tax=Algibacter marinivivus TaxID=2100723 RepID=A0A2U2X5W3_9FLAO|nr:hypothetical protein [Algibacter marinivivus]PWH83130.1 hypothetical protein DIS18_00830 [Algibacter marinivivus]